MEEFITISGFCRLAGGKDNAEPEIYFNLESPPKKPPPKTNPKISVETNRIDRN
jgi:hypothetical protein